MTAMAQYTRQDRSRCRSTVWRWHALWRPRRSLKLGTDGPGASICWYEAITSMFTLQTRSAGGSETRFGVYCRWISRGRWPIHNADGAFMDYRAPVRQAHAIIPMHSHQHLAVALAYRYMPPRTSEKVACCTETRKCRTRSLSPAVAIVQKCSFMEEKFCNASRTNNNSARVNQVTFARCFADWVKAHFYESPSRRLVWQKDGSCLWRTSSVKML